MLAEEGAQVAICGRDQTTLDLALSQFETQFASKVKSKVADLKHHEQVVALFDWVGQSLGGLDILINNAGVGGFAKVSALSAVQWDEILGTNLSGAFYCAQAALALFGEGGGDIVNIGSMASKNAFAGGTAYNASKYGLLGLSEALMLDVRYDLVRVSTVMPGSVATEFGGGTAENGRDWKIWPEDVAQVVRTILVLPRRAMIGQVEVRPTLPKRK
jgi:NAD(P)-dependent dehydrogenase (short-subunit alcohol dehydrogenase family)